MASERVDTHVRLPKEDYAKLKEMAEAQHLGVNTFLMLLVRKEAEAWNRKKEKADGR